MQEIAQTAILYAECALWFPLIALLALQIVLGPILLSAIVVQAF
jgi:hypothetical protein